MRAEAPRHIAKLARYAMRMGPVPLFSILLPTYNRAHLLGRALASVRAQSEHDWELLVADDGSSDGTWPLLQQLAADDPRIRSWRHSNRGQAASRNRLLGLARGEWVSFLDSDDEFDAGHLAQRRQAIGAQRGVDVWLSPMCVVGSPLVPCMLNPGALVHVDQCIGVGMLTVRREAMLSIGGFPLLAYGEESALLQALLASGAVARRLAGRTYVYHRMHADSITRGRELTA